MTLRLSDFAFDLPPERIAQRPAQPRDAARLLHVTWEGLTDRMVRALPELLQAGDVVVVNDTKVIRARLVARRGGARIGITLDRPCPDGPGAWWTLARNARRLHPGDVLTFEGRAGLSAVVTTRAADGSVGLRFDRAGAAFADALREAGALALPPYIRRPGGPLPEDTADYQTMFAVHEGAVAAPTAGLHFTPALRAAVEARGVALVTITLHVGAGTFLPVRAADPSRHRMHPERGEIGAEAARAINARTGRLLAVGTTSLRLLECAADARGTIRPFRGETDLFILPGYRFRAVEQLLTNFHLPRSTLFMLACAFTGTERMHAAYSHAIAAGYRFYSYGDACLLERVEGL